MAHLLSKSTYIRGRQCQKSLYLNKKRPFLRDKISAEQLAKFKRGTDVGLLAQQLFPGGLDCRPKSPSQYALKINETASAMADSAISVIYEAVFQWDDVLIILDILVRQNDGWHAYEVKSSLKISETYLQDAALQYYVLSGAGVKLHGFSIILVDADYIFGEYLDILKLFKKIPVFDEVKQRFEETRAAVESCKITLEAQSSPKIPIGQWCHHPYPCDFIGHCWKNVPASSFLHMDSLPEEKRFEWYYAGFVHIDELPRPFEEGSEAMVQAEAFRSGKVCIGKPDTAAKAALKTRNGSESYVVLLAREPAVPLLPGSRPYQPVPLAISVLNDEGIASHLFSATPQSMRNFVQIIQELIKKGEIFTENRELVRSCLKTALPFLNNDELMARAEAKTQDLENFFNAMKIFLPIPMSSASLADKAFALSGNEFKLKNKTLLTNDLLQSLDENQQSESLHHLAAFATALKASFDGLATLI